MKTSNSRRSIIPIMDSTVSKISKEIFNDEVVKECLKDIKKYDPYTYGHSLRVCSLAIRMGSIYFLDVDSLVVLGKAAALHDYGKITIDIDIINKRGKLTDDEYSEVKKHVTNGVVLLGKLEVGKDIIDCVAEHHERVDGSGYPARLDGDSISLNGKILAIADIFDAVTVKRVYNDEGKSMADAMALLQSSRVDESTVELFDVWFKTYSPVDEK